MTKTKLALGLVFCSLFAQSALGQQPDTPNPYKSVTDRLESLGKLPLNDCRTHPDVPHPEDMSLDDSTWTTIGLGTKFESGARVFRCWFTVPQQVNGYELRGARLKADLELQGDGMSMVTVYSNSYNVYHGEADMLQPLVLTTSAKPGERFLVAVRMDVGTQPRSLTRSQILIEPPAGRPDPQLLRMEILSLQPILKAYPDAQRQQELDSAVDAIDLSKLNSGDQEGFDASLRAAQQKLEVLRPWVQQFRIRAVGNSHIDMAWLWPWTETVEVVHNTFRSALDMMDEYPGFTFAASTARAYQWMEEKYPEIFHEIQERVKEGRWEIVGGMWIEPDLNMPSGESLTRQILVGKEYFKQKFGVDVTVGWNPDSFGYSWQLPQIYKKSGINYFVTQKLLWAHEFTTFPYKLFWWESPDGSKLLTYFPHDYGSMMEPIPMAQDVAVWMPSIYHNELKDPVMMYLYGVGDHGGGPTRTMLDQAMQLMSPGVVFPKVQFSTSGAFFADLQKHPDLKIPVWKNELYFQYHRGVFTTQSETKKRIRHTEEVLLDAEKYSTLAHLYGLNYPQHDLTSAWKGLLFDQFHDIMPGSGIGVNYLDAKRNLAAVDRVGDGIIRRSLAELSAHIDTRQRGTPVVVFNSLSWPRREVIPIEAQLPVATPRVEVADSSGKVIPSQVLRNDPGTHRVRLLIEASVPALGYATYFVRPAAGPAHFKSPLVASSRGLENEFVRLKVDPESGCITSLYDKRSGQEMLAEPETNTGGPKNIVCGDLLQTFVDKPKEYDAWNINADFEDHYWNLVKADEVRLSESGPLRAVITVKHHFQNSSFVQNITLYAGMPRVDVNMQADWHEKHILLKVAFPVSVHSTEATYEIPFGSIERPTTRNTPGEKAQFEVPAERWGDLSDAQHGFSLLNESKYGYDAKGNVLRLSLLRSPVWPDPQADQGHHEFTYSLYPHAGTWREAKTVRRGYELNYKMQAVQVENHTGSLPPTHSFLQVSAPNVVVTAVKDADNGDGMVVRFYEWAGKGSDVTLHLPPGAKSASEVNLMETPMGSLPLANGSVTLHTNPYEIKTVEVQFAPPSSSDHGVAEARRLSHSPALRQPQQN